MNHNTPNVPDPDLYPPKLSRRRKLLPWWVIGCIWIFMIFAALAPFCMVLGLLHVNFEMSLLGVTTYQPFSLAGFFIIALFLFKGITAVALWIEKPWAVGLAKADAIISIAICVLVMGAQLFLGREFVIRLELIAIIPYYYKMNSIQYDWENFDYAESADPVLPDAS